MPPSWDRASPRFRGERHTSASVCGPSTRTGPSTSGNVERPRTDEGPVADGKPDAVCRRAGTARPRGSAVSGIRHRRFVARRRELALRRQGTSKGHEPTKGQLPTASRMPYAAELGPRAPRCRGERHTTPSVCGPSTRTGPSTLGNVERPVSDGKPDAVCRRAGTARPRGAAVSGIRHRRFVARRRELALRRWGTSKGHEPTKGQFPTVALRRAERRGATNRRQTAWPPAAAPVTSSAT